MEAARRMLSRQVDLTTPWCLVRKDPVLSLLILGAMLRLWVYLSDRGFWMDEGVLYDNLKGVPIFDFSNHLKGDQLAPFGFLIIERLMVRLWVNSRYVVRILPLVCGIASLWVFKSLAVRWLSFASALVALALFALSDDLVYYSSELKPYSCDLLASLWALSTSARLVTQPGDERAMATLGLLGIAAPWFSFSSVFVIAGCGTVLVVDRAQSRDGKGLAWMMAIAAGWGLSTALAYLASSWLLSPYTTMYVFWDFAFPPIPPTSRADLVKLGGILLEVFVNPLNLVAPVLPALGVAFPLVLLILGGSSWIRRDRTSFLMLTIPILLALAAAAARRYPFHGRLILPLVPAFYLLLAEGTDWVRRRAGRFAYAAVVVLLLLYPCLSTLYNATGVRYRPFNSHGDLHDNVFMR